MKLRDHPIRAFALLCVAVTSAFLGFMAWRLVETLSSPEWCSKALQAERISTEKAGGLTSCVDLLTIQLKALAVNSHIVLGVFALCLLVLIVIVIAGGKLGGRFGEAELQISRDAGDAADQVAEAAADEAQAIKGGS